ncbi:hypothetical protein ACN38_g8035 [Penicillium nordicum]|uniref:Uncharacterized protein n=1 Tax=Penicillium nordicum TaxID=229535 RepID=A0A0M8NX01_9EURO|nr:hypothetical protein ACN38_g8035 [Penicillium nordicum]
MGVTKVQDQRSYNVKWAPKTKSKVSWENQSAKLGFSSANGKAESGWWQMAHLGICRGCKLTSSTRRRFTGENLWLTERIVGTRERRGGDC